MNLSSARRVLVLGTSTGAEDAVRYMHELGMWVLLTDNSATPNPAKKLADSVAAVSTLDLPALEALCVRERIDGVFAGVNEANIRSAIWLSETLGLPYFCDREQWDSLMDKARFRDVCSVVDLPSPCTYFVGPAAALRHSAHVPVPCVVKPVDASALRGITLCRSTDQVGPAAEAAAEASTDGRVIIEELLEGDEFTAAYLVIDGEAVLSSVDDRIPLWMPGVDMSFPALRVYPSKGAGLIESACTEPLQRIVDALGLKNCCLFLQGIAGEERVAVFEAGLRLAAETPHRFLEPINGTNSLHHFVDSSLGLLSSQAVEQQDPELAGKVCAILSLIGSGGTVEKVEGLD